MRTRFFLPVILLAGFFFVVGCEKYPTVDMGKQLLTVELKEGDSIKYISLAGSGHRIILKNVSDDRPDSCVTSSDTSREARVYISFEDRPDQILSIRSCMSGRKYTWNDLLAQKPSPIVSLAPGISAGVVEASAKDSLRGKILRAKLTFSY
ncbi:hypothetical protein [Siphonobacter aquaeclarae]|jgi:hypothetical protein|uniref:Lipoprotein n=1 Tax=Siphonobacter aquaeclarae TaxID=563176 RepID=A0A1G9RSS1_9BACT|nr:hypothetical protein [Siphonobacter aquaeclarae]MBO9640992.1 hypothetical protein [Siphonobacter aquaeclarae]SDM25545.1 hypothetical protein SAMN04488090_2996 [Siphonobacter aquaeclarae]